MKTKYLDIYNKATINMRKHTIRSRKFRKWLNVAKKAWQRAINTTPLDYRN